MKTHTDLPQTSFKFHVLNLNWEADIDGLFNLGQTVWPDDKGQREKLTWAFHPMQGRPGIILLARAEENENENENENGTILGLRGSIKWPLQYGERDFNAHQLHATSVHPCARRAGIFSSLTKTYLALFKAQGGDIIFNVSVDQSKNGYEKLGWTYKDDIAHLILPIRPIKILYSIYNKTIFNRPLTIKSHSTQLSWSDLAKLNQTREETLSTFIHTNYSSDFFRWRYSNPCGGYRYKLTKNGMAAYKIEERGAIRFVTIGDIWPAKWNTLTLLKIIYELYLAERPDAIATVITKSHPLYRLLVNCGFIPSPITKIHRGMRSTSPTAESALASAPWALMYSDIDTF